MDEVVCRAQNLHLREWDGEYVIYNERNDRTHLVTGVAAQIFAGLEHRSCDASAIVNAMISAGAAPEDAEQSLAYVRELELVETRRAS